MFGIGMPEMILILAVALIVIGPKKLPDLAKSLGRAMGEFKKATNDLKQSMEADTGLSDVKETIDDINKDIKESVSFDKIEDDRPSSPPFHHSAIDQDDNADADGHPADAKTAEGPANGEGFKERKSTPEAMADLKNAFDGMNAASDEAPPSGGTDHTNAEPASEKTEEGTSYDERG
ncbi:MAG: Sec-independent protein translocase protein TatB [Deltaproteobacteria bacterium]|nr:Sec-independent protein translocase protein TatB [Deltaproteobacteria bacterium]